MRMKSKWVAFFLLLIGLTLITVIGNFMPGQLDFTEDNIYTLSDGSRSLLEQIEEPITLEFYFSRSVEDVPKYLKDFATRVETLLQQYENAAGGKIELSVIDPKQDTEEEEAAIRSGITNQLISSGGSVFFGLLVIHADQEETIAFFDPARESLLEYDISRKIHHVQQYELPKLGVVSGLPVISQLVPGMMPPGQQMPQDWVFIEELRTSFEIQQIETSADRIPDDIDLLAIIHPQNLSDLLLYAIDQFVLSSRPAFIAIDPSSDIQKSQVGQQAMMRGINLTSSDLSELFDSWGIEFDPLFFVGDLKYAATVAAGASQIRYPAWLLIDSFNSDTPATAQLNSVLLVETGSFRIVEGSDNELTPLLTSSNQSGSLTKSILTFGGPDEVFRQLKPTGIRHTLAGIVRGNFKSAFPEGKPKKDEEIESAEERDNPSLMLPDEDSETSFKESELTSTVAIIADTDFLADQYSVRRLNFFGLSALRPLNDNLNFVTNVLELLSGSEDLISLRGKGTAIRPFTVVRNLEIKAQMSYQDKYESIQNELNEIQDQLRNLQNDQAERGKLVATQEVRNAIVRYRKEEADKRAALRQIRKRLREKIESLDRRLALFNLLTVPVLICIFGLNFFGKRNKRQKN